VSLQPLDELQAFNERRSAGIGSTDAAAILGVSPWSSPFRVWEEKLGTAELREPTLPMWLGLKLESVVAELYVAQLASRGELVKIRADRQQRWHRTHKWMYTHLDYRVVRQPKLIECKTSFSTEGWGEPGSADIPVHYYTQVQHEMAVTGYDVCDVPVLFGHRSFEIYSVPRDDPFINQLIEAEEAFWTSYVVTRIPPPVDGSEGARRFLGRRHPHGNGVWLPATPEQGELVDRYRLALSNQEQVTEEVNRLKNRLIEIVGDATGLRGSDFELTLIDVKEGQPAINWTAVAASMRTIIEGLPSNEQARIAEELGLPGAPIGDVMEAIIGLYIGPGRKAYRRFDFKDRRGEAE
jgi:putative phage-type endonuclease